MNHRLHLRLDQLERATDKLLAAAEALGDRAHTAPGPGQWSAAQVVHHLFITEFHIVERVEKKIAQAGPLGRPGLLERGKAKLIGLLFRLPGFRVRAPRGVAELTDQAAVDSLPALRAEWAAVRRRLERLLNEFPGSLLNRAVFRHPRSGQMTIALTLDFLLDHVLHHRQQLARIASRVASAA